MSRRGDWVPGASYGVPINVGGGATIDFVLVATRDMIQAPPDTEVATVEEGREVLTQRVIGQVEFATASEGPVRYIERIRTGIFDNSGLSAFFAGDFTLAQDANESFLWQRCGSCSNLFLNLSPQADPYWSCIDLRVSRKLTQDVALYYSVQVVSIESIQVTHYLRTWATSLG